MNAQRRILWVALLGLAVGATMLHVRVHPPTKGLTYFWATLFSGLDLVGVSLLFLSRRSAVWGLLLNSFLAFLGIVMMSDFTLAATLAGKIKIMPNVDFLGWLFQTTLPDITILVADFLVGLALYRAGLPTPPTQP
jgi:hypothetical protein